MLSQTSLPDRRLRILAFTGGFVSLALEITFARLMAPAFGTSMFVWTNIIGVILAGLSLGAYLGGRLADRAPRPRLIAGISAGTAIYILILPLFASPLLQLASHALTSRSASIFLASLIATTLLALPPMITLGMITPFVIRLRADALAHVGRDAGSVSGLATMGSILGTFAPTLWAIPFFGVRATILGLGTLLLLASLALLERPWLALLALVPASTLLPFQLVADATTIATTESAYQFIAVNESADGTRTLRMNEGLAYHSIYRPGQLRTLSIYDSFALLPALNGGELKTMANIGLAGGTIAHLFQQLYPAVRVTGIEIDPGVVEIGREYFTLNEPNVEVVTQDGRIALAVDPRKYDAIVVDAYRQPYIPFHLATKEFFLLCRDRLNEGGIFAMNVATFNPDDAILLSIEATVAAVFPESWVYQVPDSANFLIFASTRSGLLDRLRAGSVPKEVVDLKEQVLYRARRIVPPADAIVLTDDRAPVELYIEEMLYGQALGTRH